MVEYGYTDFNDIPDEAEPGFNTGAREPRRFWMPPNGENKVVFLDGKHDGKNFTIREHAVKIGGSWQNYYSCLRNHEGGCPLCDYRLNVDDKAPISVYDAMALTVVNLTGYTNKDTGAEYKNYRELLVIKGDLIKKFKKWIRNREGLRKCVYEVSRTSKKKEAIGDDWDFLDRIASKDWDAIENTDAIEYPKHSTLKLSTREDHLSAIEKLKGQESVQKAQGEEIDPNDIKF